MTDAPTHEFTDGLYGWITHTDLSSTDPDATRAWCAEVLGWTFRPPMSTPAGDYHLFSYSDSGGGGVRKVFDGEVPGAVPSVHVRDTQAAYDAALAAGAEPVVPPEKVMDGVSFAQVRAPGGVHIGFSGLA